MVERCADVKMSLSVLSSEGAAEDGTIPDHQVIVGQPSPFRTCLLWMKSVFSATTRRSLDRLLYDTPPLATTLSNSGLERAGPGPQRVRRIDPEDVRGSRVRL